MTIGLIYELDGILYRLKKMSCDEVFHVGVFQQLNDDLTDYKTYYKNSVGEDTQVKDRGTRIIAYRLGEMNQYDNQTKLFP